MLFQVTDCQLLVSSHDDKRTRETPVDSLISALTLLINAPPSWPAAKLLQPCPTLCGPIDGSPPGSPVPLQARTLEWVAIFFSNAWKWKVKVKLLSLVRLLATPWTVAHQAPPSMGFSRQEYWSRVPLPSPISGIYYQVYIIYNIPFLKSCVEKNIWTIRGFNYLRKNNLLSNAVDQWLVSIC